MPTPTRRHWINRAAAAAAALSAAGLHAPLRAATPTIVLVVRAGNPKGIKDWGDPCVRI